MEEGEERGGGTARPVAGSGDSGHGPMVENGAGYRIRTRGPLITNQVLYQLS